MKISNFLILWTLLVLFQPDLFAQGKLVYLNGKERRFSSAELKGEFIVYKPEGEQNIRKADKYNVFSIMKDDGTEQVIYEPDTAFKDDPTVAEVRDYIRGEKYAVKAYKKPLNLVVGMEVGFASGLLLPAFYGLAVPVLFPMVYSQFTPKISTPLEYQYDPKTDNFEKLPQGSQAGEKVVSEAFASGYQKKARNLKLKNSLIGGAIGFSVSVTALALILGGD